MAGTESPTKGNLKKRRVGYFVVGSFATMCAALVPRLATTFAAQPTSARVEPSLVLKWALNWPYLGPALMLAALVGGIVLVLEWDRQHSPGEIFMAALAVPALITGAVNGNQLTSDLAKLTDASMTLAEQLADAEDIAVDEGAPSGDAPDQSQSWDLAILPSAFASGPEAVVVQIDSATRFKQVRYWVVLEHADTKQKAERAAERIGSRYGSVSVRALREKYYVVLGDTSHPYTAAVSKAVDVKRKSRSAVQPTLIRADSE